MTQITLQVYLTDIQKLLDDNRLTEAVAHCKHILQRYPRYIEAYRLLGKALLEQHEYVSAADIFQRILSADPEDFVAYVGLSVVYKAEELMNEAIWHMERAYELQPYNPTIQHELRDLYAWRDGELKTRELQLTSNALARLHFNSELYQQAVSELRSFLKDNPNRVDAQSLLAEALWRDNQRVDAVEVCLQLLETLPYCIKANAILSEIWLMTGRIDEAQEYLEKLQAIVLPTVATLNEDTTVGHAFGTDGAIPVPPHFTIEKLDKVTEEEVVLTGVPDWVDELELSDNAFLEDTFGNDDSFGRMSLGDRSRAQTPDWLQALTTPTPGEQGGRESADVLDWLREVASGAQDETLTLADDLPGTAPAALDEEASLPDWLSEVLDDDALVPAVATATTTGGLEPLAATPEEDEEAWLYDDATDAPPGIPDWMSDTPSDLELHAPAPRESLPVDELPDWLDEDTTDNSSASSSSDWFDSISGGAAAASPDDDQLASWLDSLAGDNSGGTPTQTSQSQANDLPDWFSDMTAADDNPPSQEPIKAAAPDVPSWLRESQSNKQSETPLASKPSTEAGLPDWLSDLTETTLPSEESVSSSVSIPDWLDDVSTGPASVSGSSADTGETELDAAALPDWLSGLSEGVSQDAAADTPSDFNLPNWLTADEAETSTPEAIPANNTPASEEADLLNWLSDLSPQDDAAPTETSASALSDWFMPESKADMDTEPESSELPDWLSSFSGVEENEPVAEPTTDFSGWLTEEPVLDRDALSSEAIETPDWLNQLAATDDLDQLEEADAETSSWFMEVPDTAETMEPADETSSGFEGDEWLTQLPTLEEETDDTTGHGVSDWLKAMPEPTDEEPAESDETTEPSNWLDDLEMVENLDELNPADKAPDSTNTTLPDWLKDLNSLEDSDDTAQKKSEFLETEAYEAPSSLAEPSWNSLADSAPERETTTMPDSPQKNSHDDKAKTSKGELDWLDELANLPLDEPTTVPSSESDLEVSQEFVGERSSADDNLDETDMTWLDAMGPSDAIADQTLDWLDQMDQPEVEEAPTLSWLSETDLQGQATGAYSASDHDDGEDLEEAMSWLESLVTDQTPSAQEEQLVDVSSGDALNWMDELDDLQVGEDELLQGQLAPAEEIPTTVEAIPDGTGDADFIDDLFSLSDEEAPEDIAAAMSWLDELAQSNDDSTRASDLAHAGPPPDDPEAAMAWLEQLAAAQAAELDDEMGTSPALAWDETDEEATTVTSGQNGLDWIDELVVSGDAVDADEEFFDLEQPIAETIDWLETGEADSEDILDEPASDGLPNWLDELAATPVDDLIGDDTVVPGAAWLDSFAAADEPVSPDEPAGEALPNWLDELAETPVDAPLLEETAATNELEAEAEPTADALSAPTYVPPTNISAEAAKILDMSDLFDLGAVEESEEDMAQAMAWMNELMGDMGVTDTSPAPEAEVKLGDAASEEPATETQVEVIVSHVEAEFVADEVVEVEMEAKPTLTTASTYVPPTDISPEAAKILDMSDLFDLGSVEESEEDMAQAMAWMEELMGDMGTTTPSPMAEMPVAETTPEPEVVELEPMTLAEASTEEDEVDTSMAWLDALAEAEPEAAPVAAAAKPETSDDEAMAWLDEIVAEIGEEPVAAAASSRVSTESDDEAMAWLDEIVADLSEDTPPKAEVVVVTETPTEPALSVTREPEPEPVATQPSMITPTEPAHYTPPTDISPEAAKILDMSDLFDLGTVEESEEDMAQAMAWMAELMGDMGTPQTPTTQPPATSEPESDVPETVISATPIVVEEDSAVDWLDELASQETPFSALPDLDKPFTIDDLETTPPTEEDAAAALDWLNELSAEQETNLDQPEAVTAAASRDDALLDELTNIPEDPDAAMDWLEQMAAQQEEPVSTKAPKTPVIEEPRTPAVPPEVMDAIAKVETKREKAKTGPLKPPPDLFPEQKGGREEPAADTPMSLISELTSGDVAESMPDWLSLDVISEDDSTLSWLSDKDLDATGWLESEAEMVDVEPEVMSMPLVTPSESVRDEPAPRREPAVTYTPPPVEPLNFRVNLDVGSDEGTFAAARQLLNTRQYDDAIRSYSSLLETSPTISPVITELEGVVDTHPSQPLLRRLLGDAYMRNGQLQKALETYRKALDQL